MALLTPVTGTNINPSHVNRPFQHSRIVCLICPTTSFAVKGAVGRSSYAVVLSTVSLVSCNLCLPVELFHTLLRSSLELSNTRSLDLTCEPSLEPLHMSAKLVNRELYRAGGASLLCAVQSKYVCCMVKIFVVYSKNLYLQVEPSSLVKGVALVRHALALLPPDAPAPHQHAFAKDVPLQDEVSNGSKPKANGSKTHGSKPQQHARSFGGKKAHAVGGAGVGGDGGEGGGADEGGVLEEAKAAVRELMDQCELDVRTPLHTTSSTSKDAMY